MKEVVGFPMYTLYEDGRVYSKYREAFLTPVVDTGTGYPLVTLVNEGIRKNKHIHRLLAEHYIPNPENKPQVNHIDGVKTNYELSNLEWVTAKENSEHAAETGLIAQRTASQSFAVKATSIDEEEVYTFPSLMEASRQTNASQPNITKVLKGLRKSAGGFYWELL